MRRRLLLVLPLLALAVLVAARAIGAGTDPNAVGPALKTTVDGRHLEPYGTLVGLGNFPTGGAATPDGRFYWTVSTGRGRNDVRIVNVVTRHVVQVLPLPGGSGGIAMSPTAPLAYVSGVADSEHADQHAPPGTPGLQGDVVHVFRYDPATGAAAEDHVIPVPPPSTAPAVQDFPPGTAHESWPDRLAVSPDGSTLLVPLNLADAAAIVDAHSGAVRYVSTGSYPYGAAITPDGKTGLVSNEAAGTVSVIDLAAGTKVADITVGPHLSHPETIAVDAQGKRAYVPLANSDEVAVLDVPGRRVERTLSVERPEGLGASPVDASLTPDGGRLLVSQSGLDSIAVFKLPGAKGSATPRTVHTVRSPKSIARYARKHRAARRALHRRLARTHSAKRRRTLRHRYAKAERKRKARYLDGHERTACAGPNGRQARRYRRAVLKAENRYLRSHRRRADRRRRNRAVHHALHRLPKLQACPPGAVGDFQRIGLIPTASEPMAASVVGGKLLYVSAKDVGTGPNPNGPNPQSPTDSDDRIGSTQYLPLLVDGAAGIGRFPSDAKIAGMTPAAQQVVVPGNAEQAPANTPLRANGPIKHVFYIVRENRTYDQVLGDDARGDGDPKLTLFGSSITPNAHALVSRFPLLDHVFANSEASIDGHFWTSAGSVPDYVNKNWWQNYAARGRPYDFPVYAVAWPDNGFLLDQATRQHISYFNYGEAIAGNIPLPDRDRNAADNAAVSGKFANSDIGVGAGCYPNDGSIGVDVITHQPVFDTLPPLTAPPDSESRYRCFATRFNSQLAAGKVPAFNMLMLSNDHTRTLTAGAYTPRAMIADNDEALGRIVDLISHSSIWSSSAIFVVEDDSQDGADHVDAHRIPALVMSPYARPGAVIHTRYDFLSVIRSMELILGMKPLGLRDALGVPMYDAFQPTPDTAPYTFHPAQVNLLEKNPSTGPGARAASRLPSGLDEIPQHEMDRLLWKSIHGWRSKVPPPGPNAQRGE